MYCPAFLVFLAGRLPCLGGKGWSLFGCGSLICLVLVVMDGCFLMGCCFFLVLVTFQVLVFLVLFSLFPYFGFLSVSPSCLSFLMASNLRIHIVILGFICPVSSCFVFRFLDCSFILLFFLHFWFILCLTICCIFLCFIFLLLLPIWLIRLNSGKSLPLPCSVLLRLHRSSLDRKPRFSCSCDVRRHPGQEEKRGSHQQACGQGEEISSY